MPELHFLAGLPRSGSTLLMNILAQNPDVFPTTTSPLLEALVRVRNSWQEIGSYNANPSQTNRLGAMRGFLEGYYSEVKSSVVIDKHRAWPSHLEMVEELLGRPAKVICTVRAFADILASVEKLYRRNKMLRRPDGEGQSIGRFLHIVGRTNAWAAEDGLVGSMALVMKDAKLRGYRDRLHIVEFENLTRFPEKTLKKIYEFLEMEPFKNHDFGNVKQVLVEDDHWHGYEDLHTIRPKVEPKTSDALSILGEEMVALYSKPGVNFWRSPDF